MDRTARLRLAAILADAAINGDASTQATAPPADARETIREIVREHLLGHPEAAEQALITLNANRRDGRRAKGFAAFAEHRHAHVPHPMSPVSGNPEGDVTLIAFFDYQCGFCKRSLDPVMELLAGDARLRVVWKEFPVLGPVSRLAARAAMAADRQGRYLAFHVAVMGARGRISEWAVMAIAERVGLDVERLRRDMGDPEIAAYLDETQRLAGELGITGTPAFVIGDDLVRGAVGGARLKRLIAEARGGR